MVVKRDGRRQPFDRARILNGLIKACEKRPVAIETLNAMVDDIEQATRKVYDTEVYSKDLGEMVMKRLSALDEVAYVRFASVYRQFRDVNQFMDELKSILSRKKIKKMKRQKGRISK
jgi:transcriptional repressor NrdR